jgi:hypothetical protein
LPFRIETASDPNTGEQPAAVQQAPSFFKRELAHFSNDQRFVYYEHVVVGVMQFDGSRVLQPERNRWIAPSIHFASNSMLRLNSLNCTRQQSCLVGLGRWRIESLTP